MYTQVHTRTLYIYSQLAPPPHLVRRVVLAGDDAILVRTLVVVDLLLGILGRQGIVRAVIGMRLQNQVVLRALVLYCALILRLCEA